MLKRVRYTTYMPDSSSINAATFIPGRRYDGRRPHLKARPSKLLVEFISGSVYQYTGVSEVVFNKLVDAPSAGEFFNEFICDEYRHRKLKSSRVNVDG